MGACSSKSSATIIMSSDVEARRLRRQNSSEEDLARAVAEYHRLPPASCNTKALRFRPSPILISQPNSVDDKAPIVRILAQEDIPVRVETVMPSIHTAGGKRVVNDSPVYSVPTSSIPSGQTSPHLASISMEYMAQL